MKHNLEIPFYSVIFLDISKLILFCNIGEPLKAYGRFSELGKQSLYTKVKWVCIGQGPE